MLIHPPLCSKCWLFFLSKLSVVYHVERLGSQNAFRRLILLILFKVLITLSIYYTQPFIYKLLDVLLYNTGIYLDEYTAW